MANEILDGFDHYGTGATGRTNMLNGVYSEINVSTIRPTTDNPRTGLCSLLCTSSVNSSFFRRFYPASGFRKYLGAAWALDNIPSSSVRFCFANFRDNANNEILCFTLSTTGQIQIRQGGATGTVVASSAAGAFLAGIYQHVECMGYVNGASGAAEARVNGVVAVSVSGINFGATAIAQFAAGQTNDGVHDIGNWVCDDLRAGNDLGGVNDSFMGDKRVIMEAATTDGATSQWPATGAASKHAAIAEVPPDGDTSYIQGDVVGDKQQCGFAALPAGVGAVLGIAYVTYAKKTDVGAGSFRVNAKSGSSISNGAAYAANTAYAYAPLQCFDVDPATAAPWAVAAVNASLVEFERTA